MQLTEQHYELAGAYVRGELTGKALTDFETQLANNTTLQEEVTFQKSIASAFRLDIVDRAMHQAKVDNLVDKKTEQPQFKVIQNNLQKAKTENLEKRRRIRRWTVVILAAACVLLVGRFGWMNHLTNDINTEIVTMQMPRTEQLSGNQDVSARESLINARMNDAEDAYAQGKFEVVRTIFAELREKRQHDSAEMSLYEGMMNMQEEKYEESIEALEKLITKQEVSEDARWLLGLAYLKNNEKRKAKTQFDWLCNHSAKYNVKANAKLKKHFIL